MSNSYEELMDRHTELKLLCLEKSRHIALLQNARTEQRASQRDADRVVAEILEKVRDLQRLWVIDDSHAKWWELQETKLERGDPQTPPTRTTETSINWDGRRI